jgi:glutathione S-transferase
MKIIETRSAPNPRRVRIFLAEKGLTVPFEEMTFTQNALRSETFTKLNPLQKVPVLVLDDGTAISETVAICRYFEELHPTPALFGEGAVGRATVEMWQRRMELNLLLPVAQAFRHLHPSMAGVEEPQVPAWGEANKPRALAMFAILDNRLSRSRFIAGDAYSIADITALCAVDFARAARVPRSDSLTHLARWHVEVSSRPSAKA